MVGGTRHMGGGSGGGSAPSVRNATLRAELRRGYGDRQGRLCSVCRVRASEREREVRNYSNSFGYII